MGLKLANLSQPIIMGILNVTNDSFYDGNKYVAPAEAILRGEQMVAEGAGIIDVGGESTRPYAQPVSIDEELARVIPVIEGLAKVIDVPIAIDTSKPEVMHAAVQSGASLINDVRALAQPGAMQLAAKLNVAVCVMHMQGEPSNMQNNPRYNNVVHEVYDFLEAKITSCMNYGIAKEKIIIDLGFGFGKTLAHNLQLLRSLAVFKALGCPILVAISRKSMIGQILALPVQGRLYGSIAAAVMAVMAGASIIRVHDVKPTVEALKVATAIMQVTPVGNLVEQEAIFDYG